MTAFKYSQVWQNSTNQREIDSLIGDRVRRFRESAGYSQRELGEMIHVSRDVIGDIERGERSAKGWELKAIARQLGATIGQLTGE